MSIQRKLAVLIISFCAITMTTKAQKLIPGLQEFKDALTNYSAEYDMYCIYPDSQQYEISGIMAVDGAKYYDSSNYRFALLNNDWYVVADHSSKEISIAYVAEVNRELEGFATVSASNYLLSDELLSKNIKAELITQDDDTSVFKILFLENDLLEEMLITIRRSDYHPVRYRMSINYPANTVGFDDSYIKLELHCYNIQTPANQSIFDESRIVKKKGGKHQLIKYRNYELY